MALSGKDLLPLITSGPCRKKEYQSLKSWAREHYLYITSFLTLLKEGLELFPEGCLRFLPAFYSGLSYHRCHIHANTSTIGHPLPLNKDTPDVQWLK